jgi:hypothetical protein
MKAQEKSPAPKNLQRAQGLQIVRDVGRQIAVKRILMVSGRRTPFPISESLNAAKARNATEALQPQALSDFRR